MVSIPARTWKNGWGRPLDWLALDPPRLERARAYAAALPALPGVNALVEQGTALGYRLGVASNSDRAWVQGGLARLGLAERFAAVRTRETVNHPKPHPDVYLGVLADLGAGASGSLALKIPSRAWKRQRRPAYTWLQSPTS